VIKINGRNYYTLFLRTIFSSYKYKFFFYNYRKKIYMYEYVYSFTINSNIYDGVLNFSKDIIVIYSNNFDNLIKTIIEYNLSKFLISFWSDIKNISNLSIDRLKIFFNNKFQLFHRLCKYTLLRNFVKKLKLFVNNIRNIINI